MLGLILAGGRGSRFGPGEKPLALCGGRPLIEHVVEALVEAGLEVVIVVSPHTPFTQNWCRAHDLLCVCTAGNGYVEDLAEAGTLLGPEGPVLCASADLPCLSAALVVDVIEAYWAQDRPALSVWVPVDEVDPEPAFTGDVDGRRAAPAGLNILDGGRMDQVQEEARLLLDDPRLRHNVNTTAALEAAEAFLALPESPNAANCIHRKRDIDRSTR